MSLAAGGFLSPGRHRGPSPSSSAMPAPWMHTARSDVQRTQSYEPTRMVSAGAPPVPVNPTQAVSYQPPVEPPVTARPTWSNADQVRAAPVPQHRPSGHAGHPPANHPGGPQAVLHGGQGSASSLHPNHPRRPEDHPAPQPPQFAFTAQGTQVAANAGPMPSPAIPDDRAPRSLGGCSTSDTKSVHITTVQHRTSSSSAAHNDFDAERVDKDVRDMKDTLEKVNSKLDQIGSKEDYEKAKQDLAVEKQKSSELRSKIHDLQNAADQMQKIAEAERERQTSTCNKKDMDLSDMEQKCRDLKVDLDRKHLELDQVKATIAEKDQELERLNELQRDHNSKVSDYIEKMKDQWQSKVQEIHDLEATGHEKDVKIRELTSQLKDEKQKKDSEVAKRRISEQQMKDTRAQKESLDEQIIHLKGINEDLNKAKDQAMKSARAEQNKVKVLDEQKRELERERSAALEQKAQVESNLERLKDRLKATVGEYDQFKVEHANDVEHAKRIRSDEINDLRNRLLEGQGHIETLSRSLEQATCEKERAEQILAEERQEFQITKMRVDDLKKQLERADRERSRKMSMEHDKENMKMQETIKCQKATIWNLESQLRQERNASTLTPKEAARILKVREDTLIEENNGLNIELCLAKDEIQRLKGVPKSQHPQLEMQQQPSFAEPSSLVSTPSKHQNKENQ